MPTKRQIRLHEFLESKKDGTPFSKQDMLDATKYRPGTLMNMLSRDGVPGVRWIGGHFWRYTPEPSLEAFVETMVKEKPSSGSEDLLPVVGMLTPTMLQEHEVAMERMVDRLLNPKRAKVVSDPFADFIESQLPYNGVLRAPDGSPRRRVTERMG